MKKILTIAVILLIIVSVTLLVYVSQQKSREGDDTGGGEFPVQIIDRPGSNTTGTTSPIGIGVAPPYSVATASGGTILVNQFLEDPDIFVDPLNEGHLFLGNRFPDTPDSTILLPSYIIEYIAPSQTFNVALLKEPIGESRAQAEQYLAAKLGLTPQQLCDLKYLVTVSVHVNDVYAGSDLKFSSCPGATQF